MILGAVTLSLYKIYTVHQAFTVSRLVTLQYLFCKPLDGWNWAFQICCTEISAMIKDKNKMPTWYCVLLPLNFTIQNTMRYYFTCCRTTLLKHQTSRCTRFFMIVAPRRELYVFRLLFAEQWSVWQWHWWPVLQYCSGYEVHSMKNICTYW